MKELKAITSIYHLIIMFPTVKGTGYVRGSQYDSRECYNQSVRMAIDRRMLPQIMMVEPRSLSKRSVETNMDTRIQDEKRTAGPTEELVEVIVDDKEPTRVLGVGRNLEHGRFNELIRFLLANLDVFTWRHEEMVDIHPDVMCHCLNIDLEKKPIR